MLRFYHSSFLFVFLVHFLKLHLHFPREIKTFFIHECLVYVLKIILRVSLLT